MGILGIRDLTKIQCGNQENDKYLNGIRDLTALWDLLPGLAKTWAWDVGFFSPVCGNSGNHHDPNKSRNSQSHWCLLSNQSIECAWLRVSN